MKLKIPQPYQTIRDYDALVRLLVLTFLGAVIQTIVFFNTFWTFIIQASQSTSYRVSDIEGTISVLEYLSISLVYSIITSASFTPKRIISPLYIQIITGGVIILFLVFSFYLLLFNTQDPTVLQKLIGSTFVYFTIFVPMGWILTKIVKKIIALNGSKDDLIIETISYSAKYSNVRSALIDSDLLKEYELKIIKNDKDSVILKSLPVSDIKTSIVLIPNKENECILSIVTFEIKYDTITKTKRAKRRADSIERFLAEDIELDDKKLISAHSITETNDAEEKAVEMALENTKTPLRVIPYRHVITLVGLAIIAIIIWQQHSVSSLDSSTTIGGIIAIITTAVLLLVPTLKEKMRVKD